MKSAFFYSALIISLNIQAQVPVRIDTVFIDEVEIKGKSAVKGLSGSKTIAIDSSVISDYSNLSIADLLTMNSQIYVKSYGSGGLATTSFRGTGPSHTQIAWNDININNPMSGQYDLSLVPAGLADGVDIYCGNGSMMINGGAFGGIIDISSLPDWNTKSHLYVNAETGSFGRKSVLLKYRGSTRYIQSSTKVFIQKAENNFRYMNTVSGPEPFMAERRNNQVKQSGFIEELYFRKGSNNISARIWYQSASRNLPVPIISPDMNQPEKQSDESLRVLVNYDNNSGSQDIKIIAGFITDRLDYENKTASIDSRNLSKRFILKSELIKKVTRKISLRIKINDELNSINSNNYNGTKTRNVGSADALGSFEIYEWLNIGLLARGTLQDDRFVGPDYSVGADIKPFALKDYLLKTSFSKNSRIPSLNEMYWHPGGNPDLKNENGNSLELTWEMTHPVSISFVIKNNLSVFRNDLKNTIQWKPGNYSYWESVNLDNVLINGIEAGLDVIYSFSDFKIFTTGQYSYTKAEKRHFTAENPGLSGKQVIYIPVNKLNSAIRVSWRNFYSAFFGSYTGRRFLTADNSQYMPGYSVYDLNFGVKLDRKNTMYDLNLALNNIFNSDYQNLAYYPMPGRNFMVSAILSFKK